MKKPSIRPGHGPEWREQQKIIKYLRARQWLVEVTNGNQYQVGIPDLYLAHLKFGQRWVDVKNASQYTFTKAQKSKWPKWEKYGVGIWIMTSCDDYDCLFKPPNWRVYWKSSWDKEPTIDELLDEL
jgi:hypothetical protein